LRSFGYAASSAILLIHASTQAVAPPRVAAAEETDSLELVCGDVVVQLTWRKDAI